MVELSVCLPVHHSARWYLSNTLLSFANQTASKNRFEIVVATDGGDPKGGIKSAVAKAKSHGLRVILVNSPRTSGHKDVPHRNHTRNAACRASSGRLVWILDSDFMVCPVAIEHILDVHGSNKAIHSSICLAQSHMSPNAFMAHMGSGKGSPKSAWDLVSSIRLGNEYSGFMDEYSPSETAVSIPKEQKEGMPIVSRPVGEALGWFDEFFLGWGGEKEEFVQRLRALCSQGLINSRLITSVFGIHQPHPKDPEAALRHRTLAPRTTANRSYYQKKMKEIREKKQWWLTQVQAVKKALNLKK